MTTAMNIENYHLKWDSHLSYLNLSVATLFKNEKFADVMLISSNAEGGSGGIPAHRIILSSCSHFFASIFELTPSTPNNIIYIVLPPELSKRSIQILVQYMYSGEATVSNDILNEVLRGGEILKIRGLYRNNNGAGGGGGGGGSGGGNAGCGGGGNITTTTAQNDHNSTHSTYAPSSLSRNLEQSCCLRSAVDHDSIQPELRGLGASATVLPKESPVIVRSPKPAQQQQHLPTNAPLNLSSVPHTTTGQNITVKKDVAIDPDENCLSSLCYGGGGASFHNKSNQQQQQHNIPEDLCKNFSTPIDRLLVHERDSKATRRHSEEVVTTVGRSGGGDGDECNSISRIHNTRNEEQNQRNDRRRTSLPGAYSTGKQKNHSSEHGRLSDGDIQESLNFLSIKQEPIDWQGEIDNENSTPPNNKQPPLLDVIKIETSVSGEDERQTDEDEMVYSPLTCELCGETFTVPKEWVRHIESHMDTKTSYVPKKKRRISTNSTEYIPSLKCDLCSTFYVTPAEWVRHIQTKHTETELAICNNKHGITPSIKRKSQQVDTRLDYLSCLGKTCEICNKKFPSYASMVIHSRTHTGEKPFYCSPCNKGFNVKSNLLRHMRTLHNQIEPSTSVGGSGDGDDKKTKITNCENECINDTENEIEQT